MLSESNMLSEFSDSMQKCICEACEHLNVMCLSHKSGRCEFSDNLLGQVKQTDMIYS